MPEGDGAALGIQLLVWDPRRLRLFGPNDPTALVAEDFDSGTGANARIAAGLVTGSYLVQVQHDQPSGTGDYSVRVRRP